MARGRVWTGAQALERGLVDRLGGLDVAMAAAKERAGIDAEDDVEVVVYPRRRSVYEAFSDQFGGSATSAGASVRAAGAAPRRGPWPPPRRRRGCSAAASRWR